MWRKDPDPSTDLLHELAELRAQVETLRERMRAAQITDHRIVNRRHGDRPSSEDRRRHHSA
jgi:hypothetical protein